MTEQRFIKLNRARWEKFEQALRAPAQTNPDSLSSLYTAVMDDLSYARTHYPESEINDFLNALAVKAHTYIYGTKRERRNRLRRLYTYEIPLAIRENTVYIRVATVIFVVCIALGAVSSALDPAFPRMILGDSYVNHTLENIETGDPMAVYKSMESGGMFARIAVNNIRVAFIAYVLGILAGAPTIFILISNGIMVGGFLAFFAQRGLLGVAMSTIFLHGAMELTAIAIAGGCGLLVGTRWIFPGTYRRRDALVQGAKDSLKIMLGIVPFIVVAAFIESYLTRLYLEMTGPVRLSIVFGTFALIMWYFFIYPRKIVKNDLDEP